MTPRVEPLGNRSSANSVSTAGGLGLVCARARREDQQKGFFFHVAQKWAGAGVPSANRITLLRDTDGDGVAETRTMFLKDLNSPFGMALIGHDLYVANTMRSCASHMWTERPGSTRRA